MSLDRFRHVRPLAGVVLLVTLLVAGLSPAALGASVRGATSQPDSVRWSLTSAPNGLSFEGLSCGSPKFCVSEDGFNSKFEISNDLGRTWHKSPAPHGDVPGGDVPGFLYCTTGSNCVAEATATANDGSHMLFTSNSGQSWTDTGSLGNFTLYTVVSISCSSSQSCLLTAVDQENPGAGVDIWRTGNGGKSWTNVHRLPNPFGSVISAISCATATTCAVAIDNGNNTFQFNETTDGGHTWTTPGSSISGPGVLGAVVCFTSRACMVAGTTALSATPPAGSGEIVLTSDGGHSWTRAQLPSGVSNVSSLSCPSSADCWSVATIATAGGRANSVVLGSTDGGRTWATQLTDSTGSLSSIACPAAGQCLAIGNKEVARLLPSPIVAVAPTPSGKGYFLFAANGSVYARGDAHFYGDMSGKALRSPIVAAAVDPATGGYWLLGADGGVFAFHAPFFGSTGHLHLAAPAVGLEATPAGNGYRFVASDGGIFDFGPGAMFFGSMGGKHLNKPIVGMADDAATGGYWLTASDGGIFAFHAKFLGSTGNLRLKAPIVEMEALSSGTGYRFVASDGGVFDFGKARFGGSLGGQSLTSPVVGIAGGPAGTGYWLAQENGVVSGFGGLPSYGNA